jgi:ribosomal protein L37AE/L43A
MSFQGYNTFKSIAIKPRCPSCQSSNVEMVDSVSDPDSAQKTLPVWHCKDCEKLHGGRSITAENELNNVHYLSNNISSSIVEPMVDAIDSNDYRLTSSLNRVVGDMTREMELNLQGVIKKVHQLEERVSKAEELAADPLLELRRRVASFELK